MNTIRLNLAEPIPFSVFENPINAAIILSLFCDAREKNERGWWGDTLARDVYDEFGSRLWLLQRGKNTAETLRLTEDYARQSLTWMVRDGIATSVKASATALKNETLYLSIVIDSQNIYLEVKNAY